MSATETPTPKHDALTRWVVENIALVVEAIPLPRWVNADAHEWHEWTRDADHVYEMLDAAEQAALHWADDGNVHDYSLTEIRRKYTNAYKRVQAVRNVFPVMADLYENRRPVNLPAPTVQRTEWEYPIARSDRGTIVGYVDLRADVRWHRWAFDGPHYAQSAYRSASTYDWHTADKIVGWHRRDLSLAVMFEVKPSIPSVGALLRQLNKYKHYLGPCDDKRRHYYWVVVSPETRHAETLRSQGVHFVKCPFPEDCT